MGCKEKLLLKTCVRSAFLSEQERQRLSTTHAGEPQYRILDTIQVSYRHTQTRTRVESPGVTQEKERIQRREEKSVGHDQLAERDTRSGRVLYRVQTLEHRIEKGDPKSQPCASSSDRFVCQPTILCKTSGTRPAEHKGNECLSLQPTAVNTCHQDFLRDPYQVPASRPRLWCISCVYGRFFPKSRDGGELPCSGKRAPPSLCGNNDLARLSCQSCLAVVYSSFPGKLPAERIL
jgi:hypothetical protein